MGRGSQPSPDDSLRGGRGSGRDRRGLRPPAVAVFVFVFVFVSVSTEDCFDDLPSKTLRSKAIFSGNASQSLRPFLPGTPRVQVVEFQVREEEGDVLKTDPSLPLLLPQHNGKILVGWDEGGCGGKASFVHGHSYFVFLNGSSTQTEEEEGEEEVREEGRGARTVYWSSGSLVRHNTESLKTIDKFKHNNYGRKPKVALLPRRQNLTLVENSGSLDLRCKISGRPTPKVTWYKDHKSISGPDRRRKLSKNGAQLTVRRVKFSDAGIYFCEVSNVIGSAKSSALKVIVRQGSKIPDDFLFKCDDQNHCVNNGTCYVIANMNTVFCACAAEFTGQRCQDRRHDGERGESSTPPFAADSSLKPFLVIGLLLFLLNLFVLTVIAYCVAMTRYDNAKRLKRWLEEEDRECDIRANGAILRRTNNGPGLQDSKRQNKFSASGGMGGEEAEEEEDAKLGGLPQVLVTLIEEKDRTTSVKTELPVTSGSAKRPDVRVYCPDARSLTFPTITRPRLTAVSTTPSSTASSINLHSESIPEDQRQHC